MKYFYLALQIKENDKYYAYMHRVSETLNLLAPLDVPGLVTAIICPTRKKAVETVTAWNNEHKKNGRYLFDTPEF